MGMTARKMGEVDLDQALGDPGFTPGARHLAPLLDRVVLGGDAGELAEKALARAGGAAAAAAIARAEAESTPARARLTRLVGRIAAGGDEASAAFLRARLEDADARTRRVAAAAIGRARPAWAEEALAAALAKEASPGAREAIVEALGKVGGEAALAALGSTLGVDEGAEARARLMVTRTLARATPSSIDTSREAPGPTPVVLRCREGLERFVAEELDQDLGARVVRTLPGRTRVEATLTGPLDRLFRARTMLSFAFPLLEERAPAEGDLAELIAKAITSPEALRIFRHFTVGPIRYRLSWAEGGKRRSVVWRAAAEVARRSPKVAGALQEQPEILNDPTESPWEAVVYERNGLVRIELAPRVQDPRFAYRRGDVSGASHPTIAAALVRAGGLRHDDVVWDPFAGSGTELCERALAGPYRMLIGSDRDPAALAVARANLEAAGAREVTLIAGEATRVSLPARPTLIVTNPPLGRRVERSAGLAPALERFVEHAARALAPGGRLAWISPFAERTDAAARRGGLTPGLAVVVDLGGFSGTLQVFQKGGGR